MRLRHLRSLCVGLLLVAAQIVPSSSPASASPTVSWITWEAPASYPDSAAATGSTVAYTYATTALGSILMPDNSTVYVRLSGEVVDPYTTGWSNVGNQYGLPSGFAADSPATTNANYWAGTQIIYTRPETFVSTNVPSVPSTGDHIGLIGASTGVPQQTIEFFSDAARTNPVQVTNMVMLVNSLGRTGADGRWDFSQDFTVLSDNLGVSGATGLVKSTTGSSYRITGQEGAGALQLNGTFDRFTFEVGVPEVWASWNIGVTSALAPSLAASTLAISTQPTGGATSGSALPTQPIVRILDANSNTVTSDSSTTVTASIVSGAGGTLGGTTTVTAVNGVATFGGLTLSGVPGTDYVLRFSSSPALTNVDAIAVQVVAAPAAGTATAPDPAAPSTSCTPTEARPADDVACTVSGAEPGSTILWRAAAGTPFASGPVAIDEEGIGTFAFTVPDRVEDPSLTVELVEWDAPRVVGVVAGAIPNSVPAGEGRSDHLATVTALVSVIAALVMLRARRKVAAS